jgi:hypothetical protein
MRQPLVLAYYGACALALAVAGAAWGAGAAGAAGAASVPGAPPEPLTVSGLLSGPDGSPAAGRVELLPLSSNHDWHRGVLNGRAAPDPVATVEVGGDGRFVVEVPATGMWSLAATAPGRVPMRYLPLPIAGPVELPPLEPAPDIGIEVAVRWRGGGAVAAAWVLLTTRSPDLWQPLQADGWGSGARIGRTDAAGRIRLPRLAGEALELHAISGGARAAAAVPGGAARTEVLLDPAPREQTLELRGGAGPAAGVVVIAGRPAWPLGITGEDGRLAIAVGLEGPLGLHLADGRRYTLEALPAAETAGAPAVVNLALLPRLEGRVLDATTGSPLAGAIVWPGDDPGGFTVTDERGAFEVVRPEKERPWVQAETRGYRPRAGRLPPTGGRIPAIELEPVLALAGRVVDPAGGGVGGAAIVLTAGERERYEVFRRDRADGRAVSGADGRFRLLGVSAAPSYEVTAARPGYQTARVTVVGTEPVRLVLAPTRAARGAVVDEWERPLDGVEVTIRPAPLEGDPAGVEVSAVTGEDGRFEVAAVPAARVDLEARRPGFAPLVVPGVAIPPGDGAADLGTLVLTPGAHIAGRVTDARKRPIDGAEVWLKPEADGLPGPALADALRRREPAAGSDTNGRFAIPDLPHARRFDILIAREGFLPAWVTGVETPTAAPLAVVLEPAASLSGRVETDDGEAVPGARVRLSPAPQPPGTVGVEVRRPVNTAETSTGDDGAFAFAEVAPGSVVLEAWAEGLLPGEPAEVKVPADAVPPEVVLVLGRGASLDGRVSTVDGEPIAGARIRLGTARGESDAEGRYRLAGVSLGRGLLVVRHAAYRPKARGIDVEAGENHVDVTLEAGLSVSGRVVDEEGRPRPAAAVVLRNREPRGLQAFRAVTGADGRFRLLAVVDGRFDLEARAEGFAPAFHPGVVEVAGTDVDDLELVLRAGAMLAGDIRGVELEQLAGVEVTAERAGRPARSGAVDHRGRYEIRRLEPGHWRVRARLAGGRREAEAWVAIEPGDREAERDFDLGGGLTLKGLVLFEELPLERANVGVRGLDIVLDRSVTTDHLGEFRVENLEPGRYRVEVVHAERMLSQSHDMEVIADREIVIEIVAARVEGTVVAIDTGEGVADALVYLQRLLEGGEPGPLTTVATNATGSFVAGSLAPGRYRLTVRGDGYAPAERTVDAMGGAAAVPLTIELEPTTGLRLTVRRLAGPPPPTATVVVLDPSGNPVHVEETVLSAFGNAYLRQVPAGAWTLLIKADGAAAALARATVPGDPPEVTLPPGAPLTVRVPSLLDSRTAAHLSLTGADGTTYVGVGPGGVFEQSWPLAGGAVTVADLPAGAWHVAVTAADGRTWTGAVATTGDAPVTAVIE